MSETTQSSVWHALSQVDVSEHIEKKGGMSYLSWSWAWSEVKKRYPLTKWDPTIPDETHPDGTVTVWTSVTIEGETQLMFLPVMDHRNKAIANPDAMAINKARMRCLVKNLALYGLGMYIYAGEDLPPIDLPDPGETPVPDAPNQNGAAPDDPPPKPYIETAPGIALHDKFDTAKAVVGNQAYYAILQTEGCAHRTDIRDQAQADRILTKLRSEYQMQQSPLNLQEAG